MSTPFMIGKANAPFKLLPKHSVTQFKNRLYKKYRRLRSLTGRLLYLQVSSTVCLLHLVWQGSSKLQILISATVKKLYHMGDLLSILIPQSKIKPSAQKHRRLRSLTAHHSTVNQFQPY